MSNFNQLMKKLFTFVVCVLMGGSAFGHDEEYL